MFLENTVLRPFSETKNERDRSRPHQINRPKTAPCPAPRRPILLTCAGPEAARVGARTPRFVFTVPYYKASFSVCQAFFSPMTPVSRYRRLSPRFSAVE